jgi:PKD repeat protein
VEPKEVSILYFLPIRYDAAGTYEVSLSVWNGFGSDLLTKTCYIHVSPAVGVPRVSDPSETFFYPNPSQGCFTVSADAGTSRRTLTIRDQQGRILFQTRMTGSECTVATNLTYGVYFITLTGSGRIQTAKMVVVR